MATPLIDFCEQSNPETLRQMKFQNARRVHNSLVAGTEKRTLIWMAHRIPARINSDHLTSLGFLGQLLAGLSYALASRNPYLPPGAIGLLGLNLPGGHLGRTPGPVPRQAPSR